MLIYSLQPSIKEKKIAIISHTSFIHANVHSLTPTAGPPIPRSENPSLKLPQRDPPPPSPPRRPAFATPFFREAVRRRCAHRRRLGGHRHPLQKASGGGGGRRRRWGGRPRRGAVGVSRIDSRGRGEGFGTRLERSDPQPQRGPSGFCFIR